jgi:hypothetical protein
MSENLEALLGFAIFAVIWLAPIPLGAWMLKRKRYSPHWAWCGILPFAGLVVILVAICLSTRTEKLPAASTQQAEDASQAHAQYQKGMRELGNGLIAFGMFQALVTAIVLAVDPVIVLGLIIGTTAALNIVLGLFARRLHAWVNYVVAVLACVILALNLVNLSIIGQEPDQPNPGSPLGVCFGFIIAAALLYYSVNNMQKLRRAKAAVGARW